MLVLNLTQHTASAEQLEDGVVELTEKDRITVKKLLTFNTLPTQQDVTNRAKAIASIANTYAVYFAMIGGAPYLMAELEIALWNTNLTPLYAFSKRVSSEKIVNGKTIKVNEFKHLGFVPGSISIDKTVATPVL